MGHYLRQCQYVACALPEVTLPSGVAGALAPFAVQLQGLNDLIGAGPKVLNVSLGSNWADSFSSPPPEAEVELTTGIEASILASKLQPLDILVISAAGNDAAKYGDYPARFGSGLNYLANQSADLPIIVVEALDASLHRSCFSNSGGHVAAIGSRVLVYGTSGQERCDGTSFAAPFVTAVAGLIHRLASHDARFIAQIIKKANRAGSLLDAFNTILFAVDEETAFRYLADIDGNGVIDGSDLSAFTQAAQTGKGQWEDLNADGVVSLDRTKKAMVRGVLLSDPEVLEKASGGSLVPNIQ